MFISDGHVVLDILLRQLNYADHQVASIAHLRVEFENRGDGVWVG
jgi:hypothetical protein